MKSKDFRKGNYTNNGMVIAVDYHGITCAGVYNISGMKSFSDNEIEPMPITEEWLLKFDFTWDEGKMVMGTCWQYNGFTHLNLMPIDKGYWAILSQNHSGVEVSRMNIKEIIFVHELQNLYFSLTGEELKLKQ